MAKKFKLIAGIHVDEKGKSYKPGDVIASEHDLATQFREKFLPIGEDPNPPKEEELQRPANSAGGMAPQPSDQGAVSNITKQLVPPTSPNHKTAEESDAVSADAGDDVTEDFPEAEENDFVVLRKSRKYFVYDKDDKARSSPLEPDGSSRAADVSKVVKSALGDGKSKK